MPRGSRSGSAAADGASHLENTQSVYVPLGPAFDVVDVLRLAARDNSTLEIVTDDRQHTTRAMKLTNAFFYAGSFLPTAARSA